MSNFFLTRRLERRLGKLQQRLRCALRQAAPARIEQLLAQVARVERRLAPARTPVAALALLMATAQAPFAQTFSPMPSSRLRGLSITSRPTCADLDGDGDFDVLIATRNRLVYFENTGTAQAQAFPASGTDYPFGLAQVGMEVAPAFADLDGDGDMDVWIGNEPGNIFLLENTGNATAPAFASPVENPFGLANVGGNAGPCFADLDDDGDLDAWIGNRVGSTLYFENTGNASAPAFAAPAENPFGLTELWEYAMPAFADLDEDGDLDGLFGELEGYVIYFENTGSASAPAFAPSIQNTFGIVRLYNYVSAPTFADMDSDGDLDAWLGGGILPDVMYFRNDTPQPAPADYCASSGSLVGEEWVKRVRLRNSNGRREEGTLLFDHFSGRDGGYRDYTQEVEAPILTQGNEYEVWLYPGRRGLNRMEAYKVWMDWNRDGDFLDEGELVLEEGPLDKRRVWGRFQVPNNASDGYTRMRVQLKHGQDPMDPCEAFTRGEVEDYQIHVMAPVGLHRSPEDSGQDVAKMAEKEEAVVLYPNPASETATVRLASKGTVEVVSLDGRTILRQDAVAGELLLDVAAWQPGVYMLFVTQAGHRLPPIRLMVK